MQTLPSKKDSISKYQYEKKEVNVNDNLTLFVWFILTLFTLFEQFATSEGSACKLHVPYGYVQQNH